MARGALAALAVVAALSAPASAAAVGPIQHLVVVYDENVSFDHYFATYPNATNPAGEPAFTAAVGTPVPNNLQNPVDLITTNPNSATPKRLGRAQAVSCDQSHEYAAEQKAFNDNLMDKFVEFTSGGSCADKTIVMNYFDGNTVTALWNLAQHFTMSDAFRASTFGPSTPGHLNLAAGQTHGAQTPDNGTSIENGTVIGSVRPALDDCSSGGITMSGQNVGDLLTAKGVTWGWFQGGFRPTAVDAGGKATCGASHTNINNESIGDYVPHHEPFQYWASTANPHHLPPTSVAMIGSTDQANHQYDLRDFDAALAAGNLPAVSFLKAAAFEDGHAGYSNPVDEMRWVARAVDAVQASPLWSSTAIIVTYDDSDGWYDHSPSVITNKSNAASDQAICTHNPPPAPGSYKDRCGPGPRLPFLVVSPYADPNVINSTVITQASITRFIEDNWALGQIGDQSFDASATDITPLFNVGGLTPKTYIDPSTGQVIAQPPAGLTVAPPPPPVQPPAMTPPAETPPATQPDTTPTTPTPVPVIPAIFSPKASAKGTRRGRLLTLKFRVTGFNIEGAKLTVTVTLGGKRIGRGSTTIRSGAAKVKIKARRKLKRGRYKLSLKFTQGTVGAAQKLAIRVR